MRPRRAAGEGGEVGGGTGAVLTELVRLCGGRLTGMDVDPSALEAARRSAGGGVRLLLADATAGPIPHADIFVFSHFLLHVAGLGAFLGRVAGALTPGGYCAVLSEYVWTDATETTSSGLLDRIRLSLSADGLVLRNGDVLDEAFAGAGLDRVASGVEPGVPARPDPAFLREQLGEEVSAPETSLLSVPVRWGVYRKRG